MKTFEPGERVEFQPSPGVSWKPGEYLAADKSVLGRGWHTVIDDSFREHHYVPTRRIRKVRPR